MRIGFVWLAAAWLSGCAGARTAQRWDTPALRELRGTPLATTNAAFDGLEVDSAGMYFGLVGAVVDAATAKPDEYQARINEGILQAIETGFDRDNTFSYAGRIPGGQPGVSSLEVRVTYAAQAELGWMKPKKLKLQADWKIRSPTGATVAESSTVVLSGPLAEFSIDKRNPKYEAIWLDLGRQCAKRIVVALADAMAR